MPAVLSESVNARSAWRFGENGQAGIEPGASLTTFQQPIQPNSDNVTLGAFTEWQVTYAISDDRLELKPPSSIDSGNPPV
jgi:hypothetical protein